MNRFECVHTRAECHHKGDKCSECPITELISDEFNECLDLSYQQGISDERPKAFAKGYDSGYQKGRIDGIDELLNNVSESIIWDILAEIMKRNIGASDGADKIIDYLQKIAEQLKEQEK